VRQAAATSGGASIQVRSLFGPCQARSTCGEGVLQLKSAKQLSIGRHDTHREIEFPMDEKASGDGNSDNVLGRRSNQILDHFSIGSAR